MSLKKLHETKAELYREIRSLADNQQNWTEEDRSRWAEINGTYDANEAAIAAEESRLAEAAETQARMEALERNRPQQHQRASLADALNPPSDSERLSRAFHAFLVGGELRQKHAAEIRPFLVEGGFELPLSRRSTAPAWCRDGRQEIRAGLDVATSGAGKETIPQGFMANLEAKMLAYANVRNVATVIQTASGNALPWPTVDDTSNTGELLAEATTIGTSVDPTFATVTFNAYKFSSKAVFASAEILQDSAFDLGGIIGGLLGERLGRVQATYMTTGTGSSQPGGIVTGSAAGVTAASATALTADEVLGLVHSVDPAYRVLSSVGFMMHDNILLYARKLKDANGAYLWMPGLQAGVPDRLVGYPVSINQQMDSAMTTGKKVILFGAFEKFVIRDVASVRFFRLEERYRDVDQTGFVAFMRLDSKVLQSAAIKRLTLA